VTAINCHTTEVSRTKYSAGVLPRPSQWLHNGTAGHGALHRCQSVSLVTNSGSARAKDINASDTKVLSMPSPGITK